MQSDSIALPSRGGTLHVHHRRQDGAAAPLVCLHPAPHDGLFFGAALELFAASRPVFAPDYPGYGRSTPLPGRASIAAYARMIGTALLQFTQAPQLHLLGFHTGCLVAVELALAFPTRVGRLVLIDVPCFDPARQAALRADFSPGRPANAGFLAAFRYRCATQFGKLRHRGLAIATASSLLEPTRTAATLLRNIDLVECPTITRPAFTTGAAQLAELVDATLGG